MIFYRDNARWLFGGFLLTLFSGFGQTFFISIWGAEIRSAYDLTHGGFGFIYMMATLASAATLPFLGKLVDVTSVAISTVIVVVCLVAACILMGQAQTIPFLVISLYLLRLFGQGMMTHTAITAMGRWYSANRGKAVSFATIGHQFAEALFPITFVWLATVFGWRGSWLVAAALLLFGALPTIVILMRKDRIPLSLIVDRSARNESGRQWTRREMLRDPLFWLTGVGVFSPAFIGTSIFFHQDYLIALNGWQRLTYDLSFVLMAATTVCVSLTTGFIIDRTSAVRVMPAFMAPLSLACLVLGSFTAEYTIIVFMMLLGLSYGISSTLFGALWPEVYGTRHLGSMRAVTVSIMVFMSAAGPGLTGWLIDRGIPFSEQLIYMSAFCFFALVCMIVASTGFRRRLR